MDREAIRIDPGMAEAHSSLGQALARQGKRDAAMAAYREAPRIDTGHVEARRQLGAPVDADDSRPRPWANGRSNRRWKR